MSRGTWQGSGTFQTGNGTEAVAYCLVAGFLIMAGASWVLRHMLWIVVPAGIVLAAGASGLIWWLRGAARRKARYAAAYAEAFARHRAARTVTATVTPQVSDGTPPAVENHYHVHHHYASVPETAAMLTALPGKAGAQAITEE